MTNSDAGLDLTWLNELFKDHDLEPLFQRLRPHIASSPYSPQDWQEAFFKLSAWLHAEKKKAAPGDCFEYLLCCELAALRSGVDLPLASFVEDFLQAEGFQASVPIHRPTHHRR